jgi:hypothetical protein
MAKVRATLADQFGRPIADVSPALGVISWKLNTSTKVPLSFPKSDSKLIRANFQPGNRILMEFDNGLPAWGGVLDMPDTWTLNDYEASAWSPEKILETRQTDRGRYFDQAEPGYIFRSVITEANDFSPFAVEIGQIDEMEVRISPDYHFENLLEVAKSLNGMTGVDFWVEPLRISKQVVFRAHLYEMRGNLKNNVALVEGRNLSELKLVRQGPIVNWWDVVGGGSGWADDRLMTTVYDEESIAQYGLRQNSRIISSIKVMETLERTAERLLADSVKPRNRWSAKVVNLEPALFDSYDVGDRIRLEAPNFQWDGFNGYVRVLARNYDPITGDVVLVIEEVGNVGEVLNG